MPSPAYRLDPEQVTVDYWRFLAATGSAQPSQRHAPSPDLPDDTFAEVWNRAADPVAPLTDLPGATREPISVEVVRAR